MNPDLCLGILTALAAFVLKTAFAFGLCLVLGRLVDSPNRRFMIWLGFLYGSAAYWLWLASDVLSVEQLSASTPRALAQPAISAAATTIGAWRIPGSWAVPLGVALRLAGVGYLLVLSYILLTYFKKRWHLRWVLGFTCRPPLEIVEAFQPLAESLHAGRARLLVLSGVTSPATFGWIRPTILLPALCLEHDRSDLEDILRHELHHVRRWDFAWNGFAIVCRALLFFHPAAWYALRKMQFDRELACDLAVISHAPGRRAMYAECLVRFARLNLSQDSKVWGMDFAASSEHLKARVHSILAGSKKSSGWLLCLRTAFGLTLLAGFLGIAPSLAVLLSYAYRQVPQPLASTIRASRSRIEVRVRTTGKVRLPAPSTPKGADAAVASVGGSEASQFVQPTPDSVDRKGTSPVSPMPSGPSPQLLHRHLPPGQPGQPGSTGQSRQSVALVDPDAASQIGKKADSDRGNTLQQSALLAGSIYKRVDGLKEAK